MRKTLIFTLSLFFSITFAQNSSDTIKMYKADYLSWKMFQGKPNFNDSSRECFLEITFRINVLKINVITGKPKYQAIALLLVENSWVKPGCQTEKNLDYAQTIYDLAEIYADELENHFNKKFVPFNEKFEIKVKDSINLYRLRFNQEKEILEKETNFGKNHIKLSEWQSIIENKKKTKNNNR